MEEKTEHKQLTKEDATEFFGMFYGGKHHIPDSRIKEFGVGWSVSHFASMATFDYSELTKFVVMCHDQCIRGEIYPSSAGRLKLCIWKRQGREGQMSSRHPDLETNVQVVREKLRLYSEDQKR